MASSVMEMTPRELLPAVHRAEMRLQLFTAGLVHAALWDVVSAARGILADAASDDGTLGGLGLNVALGQLDEAWRTFMTDYRQIFETARRESVAIAFGVLPALHAHYFGGVMGESRQALQEAEIWTGGTSFYEPQLESVLEAADERLYSDGLRLSQRIWNLDQAGLNGIRSTVYAGVADSKSAFQIAEELEQYLGAGQDCPRWTRYRLYGLTKTQIAQGRRGGLYSGDECREQGVAYNALRLARTEIQFVHHLAGQRIRERLPFVEGEQVVLSPAHPRRDICDDVIEAAPQGDGVYPVGAIQLPLHPNCVTPGQLVVTSDGLREIEAVSVGDLVMTHRGRYETVRNISSRLYQGQVHRIRTSDGDLELTPDHPVLLRRGWVDAQCVQVGDEILYAPVGVVANRVTVEAVDGPPPSHQRGVTARITFRVKVMPARSIALDPDLEIRNGEVDKEETNTELANIVNAGALESMAHSFFDIRRIGQPSGPKGFEHRKQSRIVSALRRCDLASDSGTPCRIVVTGEIDVVHRFLHRLTRLPAPRTIISLPSQGDGIAPAAQRHITHLEEIPEGPIGDAIQLMDLIGCESLLDVDVLQECLEWATMHGLQVKFLQLANGQLVRSGMRVETTDEVTATDGAIKLHDNLLSLSPDGKRGAGSGNPVVGEVASLTLAPLHYTPVLQVRQRHYEGYVYNLEVDRDHSYTINGAIVHNCICDQRAVLMGEDAFVDRLRGWVDGSEPWDEMNAYANWVGMSTETFASPLLTGIEFALQLWLFGDEEEHDARFEAA